MPMPQNLENAPAQDLTQLRHCNYLSESTKVVLRRVNFDKFKVSKINVQLRQVFRFLKDDSDYSKGIISKLDAIIINYRDYKDYDSDSFRDDFIMVRAFKTFLIYVMKL